MSSEFEVVSVNVSKEKGTVKEPVGEIQLDDRGVVGDAHAGNWGRQVSLLSQTSVERFVIETGRTNPTYNTLQKILDVYGYELEIVKKG